MWHPLPECPFHMFAESVSVFVCLHCGSCLCVHSLSGLKGMRERCVVFQFVMNLMSFSFGRMCRLWRPSLQRSSVDRPPSILVGESGENLINFVFQLAPAHVRPPFLTSVFSFPRHHRSCGSWKVHSSESYFWCPHCQVQEWAGEEHHHQTRICKR